MNSKSNLECVIVIDNLNDEARNKANELNIKIMTFEELKDLGKKNIKPIVVSLILNFKLAYCCLLNSIFLICAAAKTGRLGYDLLYKWHDWCTKR
jgi:hypothetical protein